MHLSSVLGRTELCHEVWTSGPQKPQIIINENHHLALLDFRNIQRRGYPVETIKLGQFEIEGGDPDCLVQGQNWQFSHLSAVFLPFSRRGQNPFLAIFFPFRGRRPEISHPDVQRQDYSKIKYFDNFFRPQSEQVCGYEIAEELRAQRSSKEAAKNPCHNACFSGILEGEPNQTL